MVDKWILVVDDEESILAVLKNSLKKLGQEYQVITVTSGQAALEQIKQRHFDLVITDYKMPGLDGLQLLEKIRLEQPDMQAILMTAYGNSSVEAEASRLNVYRFLSKPVEIDAFRQIVKEAIDPAGSYQGGFLVLSEDDYHKLNEVLQQLKMEVGARCVFLTDGEGRSIARIGQVNDLPIARISSLLGGSIATLAEAGRTIDGNDNVINLAYREGKSDNLYAINIGSQYLLIILIERGPFSSRLGSVWISAQRTASIILEELKNATYSSAGNILGDNLEQAVHGELEKLFGEGEENNLGQVDSSSNSSSKDPAKLFLPVQVPLLSFEEALKAGIISERPEREAFPAPPEKNEKP